MASMRVLVNVPTFETISPDTFKAIWDMDKGQNEVDFGFTRGYDCARARNDIARKAIAGGYDAVLMVDSDVVVPENALVTLLGHDSGVSLGWYARTDDENSTCIHGWGTTGYTRPYTTAEIAGYAASEGPVSVIRGGGMGCALVRTWVFERLKRPWFAWTEHRSGSELSEDFYFCEKCKEAGIHVTVDARVRCKHIGKRIV